MNKFKKVTRSAKKFVVNHQVVTTVAITSAVWLVMARVAKAEHDAFLKEHDLYDLFYNPMG